MLQGFGEIFAIPHDADDDGIVAVGRTAAHHRKQAGQRSKGEAVDAPTGDGDGRHDGPPP